MELPVPGDGGSQFLAKLNKTTSPRAFCAKSSKDFFSLWLNLEELIIPALDCLVDNMRLRYDKKSRTTHNTPGVNIKIPGFGETSTIEWLDPSEIAPTWYFSSLVRSLVSWGYERGKTVRGAPYDFRKAANEMKPFYKLLEALIVETYAINGQRRVVIIAHSMGNLHTLYFLNHQPQEWKDKYVEAFVSISGPWAGAMKTLRAITSGDTLNIYERPSLSIRALQRSMVSTAWMMPSRRFWLPNEPLVITPSRIYTSADYKAMFHDLDFPSGFWMYEDTAHLIHDLKPPGIKVFCIHGSGIQTPGKFRFTNATWPDGQPEVINDDGDGSVSMRSLVACKMWIGKQNANVEHKILQGADHMSILNDLNLIRYVKSILFS